MASRSRSLPVLSVAVALGVMVLVGAGCSQDSIEERARKQAEKVLSSMGERETRALAQTVNPEQVRRAQEALTAAHEYMGEINGKLDAITVNAIEAFQRAHRLEDDGLLTEKTQRLLQEQMEKKG